jgi:hypothetical protein
MRVRPLSPTGDYTIGQPWLVNSPQAVAQVIRSRLKLFREEWFLDITDGTPWFTDVLGERYKTSPDAAIKSRILGTPGVSSIVTYSSVFSGSPLRTLTIKATVQTIYSVTPISISVPLTNGPIAGGVAQ